jgi:NAD(P)-dependent dehydrogenase (short-subunit alcohol dehydrogenase family)
VAVRLFVWTVGSCSSPVPAVAPGVRRRCSRRTRERRSAAIDGDERSLRSTAEDVRGDAGQIRIQVVDVAEHQDVLVAVRALADEMGEFHGVFANAAVLHHQSLPRTSTGNSGIACST